MAVAARRDLEKMRRGIMDTAGAYLTERARDRALLGVLLGSVCTAFWTYAWLACARL